MLIRPAAEQKLISFSNNDDDLAKITKDIKLGWTIISMMQNGESYVGVMEKILHDFDQNGQALSIYIPPRRKIKISY